MATTEMIEGLKTGLDALMPAINDEKKVEFDKGWDEAIASNTKPGDKVYTQEEMNAEIMPREERIVALMTENTNLKAMMDGLEAAKTQAVAEATAALKAYLLAKYEEAQVAESAGEVGFKDLLV